MFDFIKSSLVLVILCILPFVQSEVMLKRFIKLQKEKYGSDQVSIDLIFDNDGIISVEQSTQNKSKIMYKDIKQVKETKEILITHNQQVDPIIEIIFTHKSQEN